MIVFDINNKNSFENVQKWCEELRYYSEPDLVLLIVGNKKDKERQIKEVKGHELAKELDSEYYETSVRDEHSVKRVFEIMAEKIFEKKEIFKRMNLEKKYIIEEPLQQRRKCC